MSEPAPAPGSPAELAAFAALQARLGPLFERVFPDRLAPRVVVVVPSLSFDPDVIGHVPGVRHYEERMLCLLMLLRLPRTRVIYLSSTPIPQAIIAYYANLLSGVPGLHARRRLTLLTCHDASPEPLTAKLLARPRLLGRLQRAIGDPASAHMACFTVTGLERSLAVRLGIPIYGCDPALAHHGSKSGSREIFRAAGIELADGFENLGDREGVVAALAALKRRNPELGRAVVKLDEGASGKGNAVFSYRGLDAAPGLESRLDAELAERLEFEAEGEALDHFLAKLGTMRGIVEAWVEGGDELASPSAQCRIDPLGRISPISTHDQVLGGHSGQVFLGSTFPARRAYRLEVQEAALRVAAVLRDLGVVGRFAIDFVSVRRSDRWHHHAIEINLRKGGTTHTFLMLQFLIDGEYEAETGRYLTRGGQPRCYYASDNLANPAYRRLTPDDLIDIAVDRELHFHGASQQGVVFHLMGGIAEAGKVGLVCVGEDLAGARRLYDGTREVLDREARDC